MTRRKGETTGRMNERNYPNIVELPCRSAAFARPASLSMRFTEMLGTESKYGRGHNDEGQWYVRYCFTDPTVADAFRDLFGGERLTSPRSSL